MHYSYLEIYSSIKHSQHCILMVRWCWYKFFTGTGPITATKKHEVNSVSSRRDANYNLR